MNWRSYSMIATSLIAVLVICLISQYAAKGCVTFTTAAQIATVVAAGVGAITLVVIARQLNLQAQLARATNSQSFVNVASQFVLAISVDSTLSSLWHTKGDNYETLDAVERAQYRYLVAWWLTFFENLLYQHKCGLIDIAVYDAWLEDEFGFISRRRVEKVWLDLRGNYSKDFVDHFEKMLGLHGFVFPPLERIPIGRRLRFALEHAASFSNASTLQGLPPKRN